MKLTTLAATTFALITSVAIAQTQPQTPRTAPTPAAAASAPGTTGRAALKPNKTTVLVAGTRSTATELDVEAAIQQYPLANRRSTLAQADQVQKIAEDVMMRRDLAADAERLGLHKDPLVAALLKVMREKVLSEARLYDIGKASWPTEAQLEAEARKLYDQEPGKFGAPKRQRVSHILFAVDSNKSNREEARAKAAAAVAALKQGTAFEDLARTQSEDLRTKGFGGDIGYFTPGTMVPEFEAAVDKLAKVGDISEPVETQFGVHIAKLTDRRAAEPRPFDDVKIDIMRGIRDQAHRNAINATVEKILKSAKRNEAAISEVAKKYGQP